MPARIILKKEKEKPLLRGHPWIFSGAVAGIEGSVSPGDLGEAYSHGGRYLGTGYLNPHSQIVFRLLTRWREEIGLPFFRRRLRSAAALRGSLLKGETNAYRLINGEGDFLPGLVVDRYGDVLVAQFLTAGMDRFKEMILFLLAEEAHPAAIYERSDAAVRREEDLPVRSGQVYGEQIPERIGIEEEGCRFQVSVKGGQKTGFYLDQRENRLFVRGISAGKRVLDCFSYTGAFSVQAGLGGAAEVTLVDSSGEALILAEEHLVLNGLGELDRKAIRGDAFEVMRSLTPGYDLIILDPPPFAKRKGHVMEAARGYKDLNLQAFRLLKEEGLLLTFSCSHHIERDLFQKIVFSAAVDAGRDVQLLGFRGQPIDHPVNLSHPEGEYLKGIFCRAL
jgi:23S rRNA (cytosine1962-C5)-methyltransferase